MSLHRRRSGKKRICIDMDEVIADAVTEHLFRYNRDHGGQITKADLKGKWLWDLVTTEHHDALEAYLRSEDFFAVLDVMPESQRVIRQLQDHYDVFIASAAMEVPTSFTAKYNWLAEHFPYIPASHIVFCGDKGILDADFLIDDNPRQLRRFGGEGILYSAPHNTDITEFKRVSDWLQVEQLFLR